MVEDLDVDRAEWADFVDRFAWAQGEHVSMIGPTGAGKTTLALSLLPMRKYVVVLATKKTDPTLDRLADDGYRIVKSWPTHIDTTRVRRVILWPKFSRPTDVKRQRTEIGNALMDIFQQGGWTVFADELRYIAGTLKLSAFLELIWQQGRSAKLTLVGGTQRPAHVPLMMYDQATHLFFWRDNDEANLKRIGGIGSIDARKVRQTVGRLEKHDALYLNTRTSEMVVTRVDINAM